MHTINFYPVNNGDSAQIVLENGKRILLDYRQCSDATDNSVPSFNVAGKLREDLENANRDYFDVVAFTHADKDHIEGCTEFFELRHAEKYQGEGRIKIDELWVPASIVLESATNDEQSNEFVILRQEARYRLKEGSGIKIFAKPQEIVDWMENNDVDVAQREHLFVDAGTIVSTFSLDNDGIEFFCHSPFMKHIEGGGKEIRNQSAIIFNIRIKSGAELYDFFAIGDSEWKVLEEIVAITKNKSNNDRLEWDLFKAAHHCSYLALSDEKGDQETVPKPLIKELLESGRSDAYIVSSSKAISFDNDAYQQTQPPHVQARNCYQKYLNSVGGRKFLVTMEEPNTTKPEPIVFEIGNGGMSWKRKVVTGATILTQSTPPRAGKQ